MKNQFVKRFENNIKFTYSCFYRVIVRGYIRKFFTLGFVVLFLKAMGFTKKTKGVLRIFTDQLNAHISKEASKDNIPNYMVAFCQWWKKRRQTSIYRKHYNKKFSGKGNHVFWIITGKEPVQTIVSKELKLTTGRLFTKFYHARKPVKHYYIYFNDAVLGGPCYLKISSYLTFQSELYINGHNYIKQLLDQKGIHYRMKENAIVDVKNPEIIPFERLPKNVTMSNITAKCVTANPNS